MSEPVVIWQVRRRPPMKMLAFTAGLALLLGGGSTVLIHALMGEPSWLIAGLFGGALGLSLIAWIAAGSSLRLLSDGRLVYALRGTDCAFIDGRRISSVTSVNTGVLVGLGLRCPPDAVTLLSRKGFSYRDMELWEKNLGVTVVAEFLTPEDATTLQTHLSKFFSVG